MTNEVDELQENIYGPNREPSMKVIGNLPFLVCLLACAGCQILPSEPNLKDQVSGTGEIRLRLEFEKVHSTDVHVFIDDHYVGKFAPPLNSDYMTFRLPAGLRTIRVEGKYEEKEAAYERQILLLGDDSRQIIEAKLDLD